VHAAFQSSPERGREVIFRRMRLLSEWKCFGPQVFCLVGRNASRRHTDRCQYVATALIFPGAHWPSQAMNVRQKLQSGLAIHLNFRASVPGAGSDGASYVSVTRSVFPATWRSPEVCAAWHFGGSVEVECGTRRSPFEFPRPHFFFANVRTYFTRD
jgi:hypothetical protein